ncbi:MAG: histidine kinase [Flavobacterium sp.]|uniref:Hpt domain-containing protein n=1 Tax=unclassified Flavobacterium TaxID=196869 RepID=UPI000C5E8AE1|nr:MULTISPECIES: Hpt domain-containing protein [unclassified Flavobacterium]MBF01845.1 histidine kinase [Flavobacterium sp.]MCO6161434.1 Hpt domain-containing protein [Flavobacterium sp. NRK F7]|tara:strand:+ start:521 stop:838 length:318 start_codon:yes stop_codon:yes gene_type:complete
MEKPNLTYIEQLAGDNSEFKAKMIAILKKELPEEIAVYKSQMQNNNWQEAAQSVHKLKHKVSILGLEKSYYLAETFEENLKNKVSTFQNEFEIVLEAMSNFVQTL